MSRTVADVGVLRRRVVNVGAVGGIAVLLTTLVPVWLPVVSLVDVARGRRRLPLARLLAFGLGWAWLETVSVTIAGALWLGRRHRDLQVHYTLQRWWADRLMRLLRVTTGIRIEADGVDTLTPGPLVVLCRHASLADSLVSAWVITTLARLHPRYVLKRELLADPCLDIVGNRLPNHFLDREAPDAASELAQLGRLAAGMGERDVAVIFPEGTRASPRKRERALARIAERDPGRAERLAGLTHLLPPRPAGTAALVGGAPPGTDVAIAWHTGFDGLDTFGGILRHLAHAPHPGRFSIRRIPRDGIPPATDGDAFLAWLDDAWLRADADVAAALTPSIS